jgi:hypothetical protein
MPLVMVAVGNFNGGKKLLNYPKYTKISNPDTHVRVFKQAIKVNGVTQEGTKITYFQWTLWDTTLAWGDNFVDNHLDCTFGKFAQSFCRSYRKVVEWMNKFT